MIIMLCTAADFVAFSADKKQKKNPVLNNNNLWRENGFKKFPKRLSLLCEIITAIIILAKWCDGT